MNDIENEKIDRHSDELQVESDEKLEGKKIEVDEDRLPSRAMAIHEHIRQDGEKEMERDADGAAVVSHRCGTVDGCLAAG
ncbi:Inner membrane protein yfdC [Citrobacter freundii]|nr:Inner membrane protein yfdC [Citrobacter freundii]